MTLAGRLSVAFVLAAGVAVVIWSTSRRAESPVAARSEPGSSQAPRAAPFSNRDLRVVVFGRVEDRAGRPVAGVRISLHGGLRDEAAPEDDWCLDLAETSDSGEFEFDDSLRTGNYLVIARGGNEASSMLLRVSPIDDPFHELNFTLEPAESIRGTVRDRTGSPIAGARIAAFAPADWGIPIDAASAHSDADGHFEIGSLPNARWHLVASKAGLAPLGFEASGDGDPVVVSLQAGATSEGTVVRNGPM